MIHNKNVCLGTILFEKVFRPHINPAAPTTGQKATKKCSNLIAATLANCLKLEEKTKREKKKLFGCNRAELNITKLRTTTQFLVQRV
jgi:hypothetical protein